MPERKHILQSKEQRNILFIVSNPASLKGFPLGFYAEELTHPLFEFLKTGYRVTIASPKGGKVEYDFISNPESEQTQAPNDLITIGFNHHHELGKLMEDTPSIDEVNSSDFDAVFVVGGGAPMITFKDDTNLHQFIADFYEQGKVIATICHGSCLLLWTALSNGELLINGKTWTGFSDAEEKISDDAVGMKVFDQTIESEALKNPNTTFEAAGPFEPFAIKDGHLITGQQQNSSVLVAQMVIEELLNHKN
ncbi:MAG: type 1 glutamine amidotransferase domain-containing protein [Saprospiraceae bacterium]|nr:type 1 glutamine amidotransferase domain-containing protein [Saprospiraceae bacterium]